MMALPRQDDFAERRKHLSNLNDEQLKARFWDLAHKIASPLVFLARHHTSPSIERSVLLRMGFSSLEAKEIVNRCLEQGLLGKGAGHCVLRLSEAIGLSYRDAGLKLATGDGWEELKKIWSDTVNEGG